MSPNSVNVPDKIRRKKEFNKRSMIQLRKLSLGKKKGLKALCSQPFSFVIRIVLYVLYFPAVAAVYWSQIGLLLHCWWSVVVPATHVVLPGTIGLPLEDVDAFAIIRSCLAALLRRQG